MCGIFTRLKHSFSFFFVFLFFFSSPAFLFSLNVLCFAGSVSLFTPTVLASQADQIVTLTGIALDSLTGRGSVRGVRFERSASCSNGTSSSAPAVSPLMTAVSWNAEFSELVVPLVNTSGLSAGLWSVCVDWAGYLADPNYVRVGGNESYVQAGMC